MNNGKHTMTANSISGFFELAARTVLSLLLLTLIVTILWAIVKTFFEIKELSGHDAHNVLKIAMINSMAILATLEVFKTGLTYFSVGRVKVTYMIDTVIVVILTELMVFWFKDIEYQRLLMVVALVFSLILARILAIKFSPTE